MELDAWLETFPALFGQSIIDALEQHLDKMDKGPTAKSRRRL